MKKVLTAILLVLLIAPAEAKIKFGVRGGYNATHMSFDKHVLESENKAGFFIGPTVKMGLPIGFALDASALYNQAEVSTTVDSESGATAESLSLKRKTFALPINLRKGFGFGENLDVFIFAGPQFDFNLSKDIKDLKGDVKDWRWSDSMFSINVGVGAMLLKHIEIRAHYNIPCGDTGSFEWKEKGSYESAYDGYKAKTGIWQIGAAIYF